MKPATPVASNDDTQAAGWLPRLAKWLELDRAVLYALLLRGWQLVAGLGTVLLMTLCFSHEAQGYYYTFSSLIALQTFFELGLGVVVVNVCSHEWARLELGRDGCLRGEADARARLASLGRLLLRWYAVAGGLFVVAVGTGGVIFLAQQPEIGIAWVTPWWTLVALSGGLLFLLSFESMLEGCNQVRALNLCRLIQAVAASLLVWLVMACGGELWAAVAASAARLAGSGWLIGVTYRQFFGTLFCQPAGEASPSIQWRREVWPQQWRIGVQGIFAYFSTFLFTPVLLHYHGPVVAGQMGLTWTVVIALQMASLAWVQARTPRFGMLVRERQFSELDRQFGRVILIAVGVMVASSAGLCLLIAWLDAQGWTIVRRMLGVGPTAVFAAAMLAQLLVYSLATYVRAHKREPFLVVAVVSSVAIGVSVWWLGARFGAFGATVGVCVVHLLFTLPMHAVLWRRCRAERISDKWR